ncbi:hypothetical protein FPV67DRAFT_778971 [Lyophyllum atratum]|nr:hypothetical protein FPV67DRAFT_778971 [Lyophyllum atratum]
MRQYNSRQGIFNYVRSIYLDLVTGTVRNVVATRKSHLSPCRKQPARYGSQETQLFPEPPPYPLQRLMSDQSTPPPKPKPGSLRDRIAAFEKPAAGSPPGPAPVPRPKPGGLSWKPKQPSPPSSPSTADAPAEKKAGGMSASDAKESIGKGGSLKERMAALQNRGGFGGAPPIAPKPAMEKPKWKPPPAITPVDKDDDDEPSRAEIPRSAPLPPVRKSIEDQLDEDRSEELSAAVEGEDQADADPEDEERQRRAAIAARMARLGGARVGMAPVFGSKPAARKAEPVEEVAKVETLKEGEVTASTKTDDTAAIPPSDMVLEEPSSQPSAISSEKPQPLARKSSTSSSLLTPEVEAQPRTPPTSMPLPSAPRRAAPPRRKAVKSPEIPAPTVLSEPLAESPAAAAVLDSSEALDTSAVLVESAKKASEGDLEKEVGEVDKEEVEPRAIVTSLDGASALHVVDFAKERSGVDEASDDDNAADEEAATQFVDKTPVETPAEEEPNTVVASPPSLEIRDDAESDELEEKQVEAEELEGSVEEDLPSDIEETEQPVAEVVDEPEEDEEAARRQRIAEKLAKMGGVNPFAPPPQRKPSSSSEDMHPRDSIVSPSSPPQRQSMRTASVGASTVPEGVATRASDVQLTEPPIVQPPSRKNTAESTEDASDSLPRTKSQDGK